MEIATLSQHLTKIPPTDTWTCYQFDSAVTHFGHWVESKMMESDDKGRRKYDSIAELLKLTKPKTIDDLDSFKAFFAQFGM